MGFLPRFNFKTGAMDIRRTFLWMIFSCSLLLLWNNWQVHNGKPSLFGGSPTTQTVKAPANGTATPTGAQAQADMPATTAKNADSTTVPGGKPAAAASTSKKIQVHTDV